MQWEDKFNAWTFIDSNKKNPNDPKFLFFFVEVENDTNKGGKFSSNTR